jgi:hypothetical protein
VAIDSRAKRASLVGLLPFLSVGVTNDATPDQAWRQAAGWGYFGILADAPGGGGFQAAWTIGSNVLVLRAGH